MNYKSVGLAAVGALLCAAAAGAANNLETRAVTAGAAAAADGGTFKLESTVGEVAGSSAGAAAVGLRPGHSGTSHGPGAVYGISASTTSGTSALYQWTNGAGEGGMTLEVKIATYAVTELNYASVPSYLVQTALGFEVLEQQSQTGLTPGTTYYLALRLKDASGIYGRISSALFVTTPVRPRPPVAGGATVSGSFVLSWSAVHSNVEGSTIALKGMGYEIYYSTALTGTQYFVGSVSSNTLSYNAGMQASARWYYVKAVDAANVRSEASIWVNSVEEVVRTVADDSRAIVDIPPAISQELASGGLTTAIARQAQFESGSTVVAYKFYLVDGSNNEYRRDLGGDVTLTMPLSRTGTFTVSAFGPSATYSPYDYAVYYDNGVEDVKLGGTVNPSDGTVSVLTRKTGVFKVRQVIRAQGFRVTQTVPRKIFTPNGDGVWDEFNIIFENPEGLEISNAKVYDLSGAEVGSLKAGTYNTEASLQWDGSRKGGGKAMAGIYIYQFKAGDKTYNGTVVLAR
jgi:hypothetical protein